MGGGYRKGGVVSSWAAKRSPEAAEAHARDMGMSKYKLKGPGSNITIWAKRMGQPFVVETEYNDQKGEAGDWYIMDVKGTQDVMKSEFFGKYYHLVEPATTGQITLDGGERP